MKMVNTCEDVSTKFHTQRALVADNQQIGEKNNGECMLGGKFTPVRNTPRKSANKGEKGAKRAIYGGNCNYFC